jgi:hypothetical protein
MPLEYRVKELLGGAQGINTLQRMSLKLAARTNISYDEAIKLMTHVYNIFVEEYLANGTLRLPYGIVMKPVSKVRSAVKRKFKCNDPGIVAMHELQMDPPYSMFHDMILTAIMALNIEDELRQTGVSLRDLAKSCIS